MKIKEFIEASIEGGWLSEYKPTVLEGAIKININRA